MEPSIKRDDTTRAGRSPYDAISFATKGRAVFGYRLMLWLIAKIKGNVCFITCRPAAFE
jgi:hypothetical protein